MSASLLILTIILYILGLVAALVLTFAMKNRKNSSIRTAIFIHFVLLFGYLILSVLHQSADSYFALLSFVSALAISGWAAVNSWLPGILRIYFVLYLLSVPLFIISPSRLFFIITGNHDLYKPEKEFRLESNYYLVEQQDFIPGTASVNHYKLIRKYGLFHRTLGRDLIFPAELMNAELLHHPSDSISVKGYYGNQQSFEIGISNDRSANTISKKMPD
jgi:hypothetical protein